MSIKEPELNINGEIVKLRDIKKIREVATKGTRDAITKLESDSVSINKQEVKLKEFEEQAKKLRISCEKIRDDIFQQNIPSAVGMASAEFINFLDVNVQSGFYGLNKVISAQPKQLASAAKWQSAKFITGTHYVTDSGASKQLTPGEFQIKILNNLRESQYTFPSKSEPLFPTHIRAAGEFFINDKAVLVSNTDTLETLTDKINSLNIGVEASIKEVVGGFKLLIKSKKIGVENKIFIDNQNSIFKFTGDHPFLYGSEYKTVTIDGADNLDTIARKINSLESDTNLHASIVKISSRESYLVLSSVSTGEGNRFEIKDDSKVLIDIFKQPSCVIQQASDSILIVDGIRVQSPTNKVSIYDGIDITLKSPTDNTLKFEITNDVKKIFISINELVENYNSLRRLYDGEEKNIKNGLKSSYAMKTAFEDLDTAAEMLKDLEIGITIGPLTLVERDEDNKEVKKTYQNMLIVDQDKLLDAINSDTEKVARAFNFSFDSSSENFLEPLMGSNISINNRELGNNVINMNIEVDPSLITVKSKCSATFGDISNVVSSSDSGKFAAGKFWINGQAVSITDGMSLNGVAQAINDISSMSRISAAVKPGAAGDSYIELIQYAGANPASDDTFKFTQMNIHDPEKVLRNVFAFSGTINSSTDMQKEKLFFDTTNAVKGTIRLNGIQYKKFLTLSIYGNSPNGSGVITVINNDQSDVKIDGLQVLFKGGMQDSAEITIQNGFSAKIYEAMKSILNSAKGHSHRTNAISEIAESLRSKRDEIKESIDRKKSNLSREEEKITNKFSQAINKFDQYSAYDQLAKIISGAKDND